MGTHANSQRQDSRTSAIKETHGAPEREGILHPQDVQLGRSEQSIGETRAYARKSHWRSHRRVAQLE